MKIRTTGFKGHDHEIEIGPLTILQAPNGAGKSSISDAIRFAILGYVPLLGKRKEDLGYLLRDRELSVEISLEGGKVFTRTLERIKNGHTGSVECSWLQNAKGAEHHAAVLELFGSEEADIAECLDIRELLTISPAKRSERIAQLLTTGQKTGAELAELIGELTARRLSDKVDASVPNWRDLLKILPAGYQAILKQHAGMLEGKLQEGGTAAAATWSNEEKRRAVKALKEKEAAKKELEARLKSMPKADQAKITELRDQRDRLQRDLGAAREKIERARSRKTEIDGLKKQKEDAVIATNRAADLIVAAKNDLAKAKKSHRNLGKLEAYADKLRAAIAEGKKLEAQAQELEAIAAGMVIDEAAEETSRVVDLKARIVSTRSTDWPKVSALASVILEQKGSKTVKDAARSIRLISQGNAGGDLIEMEKELDQAQRLLKEKTERSQKRHKVKRGKINEAESIRRDISARMAQDEPELRATEAMIQEVKTGEDRQAEKLKEAEADFKSRKAREKEIKSSIATVPKVQEVQDTRVDTQDQIDKVEANLDTLGGAVAAQMELASIIEEIVSSRSEREIFSALEWAAKRAREQEITEAGGPLVSRMETFLAAAGRPEKPYFRADRKACEIGWSTPDGHDVAIQVLSGGEWCIFAAALTAAVITLREAEVRILLVESGETDSKTLSALLRGIAAVADGIGRALVLTQADKVPKVKGWKVSTLERETAAAK